MDFFASQDQARRHTIRMVVLFLIAVAVIVVAVNLVVAAAYLATAAKTGLLVRKVPGTVYVWSTLITLGIIASGTIFRIVQLAQGGVAVAEMVGARRVARDSRDPNERRLLNVVEEMALASGITVPAVYIMDREGAINAFAAGYSPNEAVVAVTSGTIETLSRDELQGVVAHEFSHILNGDMRLNIRLIGVLEGITLIGAIGMFVMRSAGRIRGSRDTAAVMFGMFAAGAALTVIGYVGVFCARLIKASISRQREFLADASAVQFTRNPEGIGGALYQIGRQSGLIENRHAEELSHMYFGQAVKNSLSGLFDTHPPLDDRIKRVLGQRAMLFMRDRAKKREADEASLAAASAAPFGGAEQVSGLAGGAAGPTAGLAAAPAAAPPGRAELPSAPPPALSSSTAPSTPPGPSPALQWAPSASSATPSPTPGPSPAVEWGRSTQSALKTTPEAVMNSFGNPGMQHVDHIRQLLAALPKDLRYGAGSEAGAKAALCALLLNDGEVRKAQLAMIEQATDASVAAQSVKFAEVLRPFGPRARIPILDLAVPTLRTLSQPKRDGLLILMRDLIDADRKVSVAEFVVLTICKRHLGADSRRAPPIKHKGYDTVTPQAVVVVSLLLRAGKSGEDAFDQAMGTLSISSQKPLPAAGLSMASVEAALYELKLLAPLKKPLLIKACLQVAMADGKIDLGEGELLRAICAALDCPLPPIMESGGGRAA